MSINDNTLFGQLTLPEPEPTLDAATINLNRALAGFLAGYSGTTLDAYRLDLRQWITWLATFHTDPFAVERAHIELYARTAEQEGKARSTIGRRLSTVCGFYRYCEQERLIDRNPGAYVRRPKQDYESTTLGLDRNELGAFLVQSGLSGGRDHALASLLALNGLRISEALGARCGRRRCGRFRLETVHRTLRDGRIDIASTRDAPRQHGEADHNHDPADRSPARPRSQRRLHINELALHAERIENAQPARPPTRRAIVGSNRQRRLAVKTL